jgi:hypothetical protein
MEQNETYKKYEKQFDVLIKMRDDKLNTINVLKCKSYEDWISQLEPEQSRIDELSRKMRLIQIPEFQEIPDYGDVMTLEDFVECCKDGGFIDYDGSGNYATEDKMTDIKVYPNDIITNMYRKDFPKVVWFNR